MEEQIIFAIIFGSILLFKFVIWPFYKQHKNPDLLYNSMMYRQIRPMLDMLHYEFKEWKERKKARKRNNKEDQEQWVKI